MELLQGSPSDKCGHSAREVRAYDFLDRLKIHYYRIDHPDKPAITMEACAEIDEALGVHICKNLFLCNRQKTEYYLLLMPAGKVFKTKELSGQLGLSRLSFADSEALLELLDIYPGSVSVLGLINDTGHKVKLLIDEDVLKEKWFGCHPCENTSSLRFSVADLCEKIIPALEIKPYVVKLKGVTEI